MTSIGGLVVVDDTVSGWCVGVEMVVGKLKENELVSVLVIRCFDVV